MGMEYEIRYDDDKESRENGIWLICNGQTIAKDYHTFPAQICYSYMLAYFLTLFSIIDDRFF